MISLSGGGDVLVYFSLTEGSSLIFSFAVCRCFLREDKPKSSSSRFYFLTEAPFASTALLAEARRLRLPIVLMEGRGGVSNICSRGLGMPGYRGGGAGGTNVGEKEREGAGERICN